VRPHSSFSGTATCRPAGNQIAHSRKWIAKAAIASTTPTIRAIVLSDDDVFVIEADGDDPVRNACSHALRTID
jgi:hypothetical protein